MSKTFAEWFGKDLTGQTYDGDIDCSYQELTSLKGAPKIVDGSFICTGNQLTSLEGGPKEVRGDFKCSFNKLTSLEGAPQKVNGNFDCIYNQLTSLKDAPKEINGDFDCGANSKLTSLNGIGHIRGKIHSNFNYKPNTLMFSFDDLPKEVEEFLYDERNYSIAPEIQDFVEENGDKQFEEWEVPDLMEQIRDFALSLAEKDLMDSDIYEEISDAIDKFLEDNADYFNESRTFTSESNLLKDIQKILNTK